MSVKVRIPTQLRTLTEGAGEVEASGDTLAEILEDLESRHPGMKERLLDDSGGLRRFVNVYLNDEDVRFLDGLSTSVPQGAQVSIIPAVAGG
ncbi:MAG TPA: ubiquitin-like small modifier protein 1 [Actinomycetota bacterium]|nr:ubiquitin-like small modifier protein 1 [Actinomycetota bacterium]